MKHFNTIQLGKVKNFTAYKGAIHNITVKNGNKIFAPTWSMVMGVKNGTMSEAEYTKEYYSLMRKRYKENRKDWEKVMADPLFAIGCFCKSDQFCHRFILAEIFQKLGHIYLGELGGTKNIYHIRGVEM